MQLIVQKKPKRTKFNIGETVLIDNHFSPYNGQKVIIRNLDEQKYKNNIEYTVEFTWGTTREFLGTELTEEKE